MSKKKKLTGRNKIVLVSDDDLAVGHRSQLKYRKDTPVVIPADEAGVEANEGMAMPDFRETDDYLFFPYRQISKTIVGAGTWKATDFSVGDVLERSTGLLNRKPAYRDHYTYVGNSIGMVVNPVWQQAYTNDLGQQIPAGIDAEFVINKNIASLEELREHLKSEYNPYNAASVGVVFDWEASHEFESMWDFYDLLGQVITDDQGNESMVRRIVTNVEMYYESSLVAFGADQYALQKKDGKVEKYSHEDLRGVATLEEEDTRLKEEFESKGKFFVFSSAETAPKKVGAMQDEKAVSGEKGENSVFSSKHKQQIPMEQSLVAFALKVLGAENIEALKEGDIPKGEIQQYGTLVKKSKDFETIATKVEGLETERNAFKSQLESKEQEFTALKEEKDQLQAQFDKDKPYAEYARNKRTELAGKVKALYTASVNGNASEAILKEIEGNSLEVLEAKAETFGAKIGFSGSCKDCGSANIEFRSSSHVPSGEASIQEDEATPLWKALQ